MTCPEAEHQNTICSSQEIPDPPAGISGDDLVAFTADTVATVLFPWGMRVEGYTHPTTGVFMPGEGCPLHRPKAAAPTAVDAGLAQLDDAAIAAAMRRAAEQAAGLQ